MANQLIKLGGIGSIVALVGTVFSLIVSIMLASAIAAMDLAAIEAWTIPAIIAGIIFSVGIILIAIGMFGISKQFKDQLSMIAAIIAIIGAVLALIPQMYVPWIGIIGMLLVGVGLLLIGIPFITLKNKLKLGSLGTPTAILMIITGALFASIIGALFGMFTAIPGFILLTIAFFKIK